MYQSKEDPSDMEVSSCNDELKKTADEVKADTNKVNDICIERTKVPGT